jgi:hypothetical protein
MSKRGTTARARGGFGGFPGTDNGSILRGVRFRAPLETAWSRDSLQALTSVTSRALPKFESYGMPETAAFRGWKAQDAIEWFHGIDRL